MTVNNHCSNSVFCCGAVCAFLAIAGAGLFFAGGIMMLNKITFLSAGLFAGGIVCMSASIGGGFLVDRAVQSAEVTKKSAEIYASTIKITEAKEKVSQLARFKEDNL